MESKASLVAEMTRSSGKVVRTCKIMDLSGLGRQHLDRRGLVYFKKIIDLSQHAYPEMLGDLYIVNTPWIFSMAWKLVSPWLNEKTLSKIHILPNDRYQALLREAIDPKHIPDFLGGECSCPHQGGCVPLRDPDAGLTTVQVAGRAKHEHKLRVDAAEFARLAAEASKDDAAVSSGSDGEGAAQGLRQGAGTFRGVSVSYEFRTQKNDVAFEIRSRALAGPNYAAAASADAAAASSSGAAAAPASASSLPQQSESSEWVVLKASKRYSSDSEPVSSSFLLTSPAEIMLVFDNGFSMFTAKTVLFRVDTVALVEHEEDADEARVREEIPAEVLQSPEP